MDMIYSLLSFLSDAGQSVVDFIGLIDDWVANIFVYVSYYAIKLWLQMKILGITLALDVARLLLADYGVYSLMDSSFNALPTDVRYILHQFGVVTGIRIIIDAVGTGLVLRVMGW